MGHVENGEIAPKKKICGLKKRAVSAILESIKARQLHS